MHATHVEPVDDSQVLHTFVGRYIDIATPVDGVWKIAQRTLRNDWTMTEPITQTMRGGYTPSGRGNEPDPLDDF